MTVQMAISKSFVTLASCVALVTACSDSAGPNDSLQASAISGTWIIPLTKTPNCSSNGSPNVVTVYLQLQVDKNGNGTGSLFGFGPTQVSRPVIGSVVLSTGAVDFLLKSPDGTAASHLYGTINSQITFSGTFVDPASGYKQQITIVGCEYSATGSKTG